MNPRVVLVVAAAFLVAAPLSAVPNRSAPKKDPVKEELRKLEGTWECTGVEFNGRQYTDLLLTRVLEEIGKPKLVFKGKKLSCTAASQTTTIDPKIDPKKKPKAIDLTNQLRRGSGTVKAIYVLEGDSLKTCFSRDGRERPAKFNSGPGSGHFVFTWKRVKK